MHTQGKRQRGFTWIEVAICIVILLIIARYIWAREFLEMENQFITSLGFDPSIKYIFTVPLFFIWLVWKYRQESRELVGTGRRVVRPSVIYFALSALGAIAVYFCYLVNVGYA